MIKEDVIANAADVNASEGKYFYGEPLLFVFLQCIYISYFIIIIIILYTNAYVML